MPTKISSNYLKKKKLLSSGEKKKEKLYAFLFVFETRKTIF
jgi:hypothetical protein